MAEAAQLVSELTGRAVLYSTIAASVSNVITSAGLNPDNFELDNDSFGRLLRLEITDGDADLNDHENLWNGPWYNWKGGETEYRVATTVITSSQDVGTLGIDLLRITEDDSYWQMYNEGKWYEGPPADVFDFLEAEREDMWDDGDDDDEWESAIDSMLLSPGTMAVLHEAGIHAIDDLREMTNNQLLRIKGIGKARVAEIRDALEHIGEYDVK